LLPDFPILHFSLSADGRRLVFVGADDAGRSPVWLWDLDGRSAPRQIADARAWEAYLVAGGYVLFAAEERQLQFIYRVREDGSGLQKVLRADGPHGPFGASPDGKWIGASGMTAGKDFAFMLYPVAGGPRMLVCGACRDGNAVERLDPPALTWSADGKFLYLRAEGSFFGIPLPPGRVLPPVPPSGFRSRDEVAAIPGAQLIPEQAVFPGPNPSVYAFTRVNTHRNIYRVAAP
jgi:hypothetical protein